MTTNLSRAWNCFVYPNGNQLYSSAVCLFVPTIDADQVQKKGWHVVKCFNLGSIFNSTKFYFYIASIPNIWKKEITDAVRCASYHDLLLQNDAHLNTPSECHGLFYRSSFEPICSNYHVWFIWKYRNN